MMLTRGAVGDNVAGIQRFLFGAGEYDGRIDGVFGPMTEKAVIAWRNRVGLDSRPAIDAEMMRRSREYLQGIGKPVPTQPRPPIEQVTAPPKEAG